MLRPPRPEGSSRAPQCHLQAPRPTRPAPSLLASLQLSEPRPRGRCRPARRWPVTSPRRGPASPGPVQGEGRTAASAAAAGSVRSRPSTTRGQDTGLWWRPAGRHTHTPGRAPEAEGPPVAPRRGRGCEEEHPRSPDLTGASSRGRHQVPHGGRCPGRRGEKRSINQNYVGKLVLNKAEPSSLGRSAGSAGRAARGAVRRR